MSARDYALSQIDAVELPGWPARIIRRSVSTPTDARDLALAEQIRVGVIKNLLWLQHLVSYHSERDLSSIDPLVQKILAAGLYQLRFLDRVPSHAILDEAVEQTRRFGRKSAAGFVNAVLRKSTREADPPDNEVDPAVRCSHPQELLDRAHKVFDDRDAVDDFCRHNNAEPPTILRLTPGVELAQLAVDGVTFTPHRAGDRFVVVAGARQLQLSDWSRNQLAQVQDPTAAAVVPMMQLQPGMTVLDRCAGVGTKTLQISREVGAEGKVFAIDPSPARCATLRKALIDSGIQNVGVVETSWLKGCKAELPDRFDRVLLDVPCSNSGVLARRAEARYRQDKKSLKSLLELQRNILLDTFDRVVPGGLLAYSTCSIWPEENQGLLNSVLGERRDFSVVGSKITLPSRSADPAGYNDGGYVAVLRRFVAGRKV